MRALLSTVFAASMLFLGLPVATASAWQYPQQQSCHYTGHYDQNGQLHNDSVVCDGPQQQNYQQHWQREGGQNWHQQQIQPFRYRVCYGQFDQWGRYVQVCI